MRETTCVYLDAETCNAAMKAIPIPFVVNPNLSAKIVVSAQDLAKPMNLGKMLVDGANEAFLREIRAAFEIIGASEDDPRKGDALKALEDLRRAEKAPSFPGA